jgi:hypothetical protein
LCTKLRKWIARSGKGISDSGPAAQFGFVLRCSNVRAASFTRQVGNGYVACGRKRMLA